MELNLETLAIQNPWWRGEGLKFDPVLIRYGKNKLKWRPEILRQINFNKDEIYCLTGARGVGKTTILKLIIKELIEERRTNPGQIFYYSCQNLNGFEQLNEMIKLFLNAADKRDGRAYILLDEISMLADWQRGISHLKQAGKFRRATVILASSFLKAEDKIGACLSRQLPVNSLSFGEFVSLVNPDFFKTVKTNNYSAWGKKIEYYLDIYLLTGGFISAINDYEKNGAVGQEIYSNYLYWFLTCVARLGRDTVLAGQILEKIILNSGRAVGYQTLAQKTRARTHLTAAEYVKLLEEMFVVKTVYQSDGGSASRKAKKIYFTDPFLFWLFYAYGHGSLDYWRLARQRLHDRAVFFHVLENAVLSQLLKNEANNISYWRDNVKKLEINFLVQSGGTATPILIRYGREIKPADFNIFQAAGHKRGLIISRDELELKNKIKIMPLAYFLLFGGAVVDSLGENI